MSLVVFTAFSGQPDYGKNPPSKSSSMKDSTETGALTVKHLQPDNAAVYLCAVSKHSHVTSGNS